MEYLTIPLTQITPHPENPRKHFDQKAIDELAISISSRGVIQPILVRRVKDKKKPYQIVCGERRYRASIQSGLSEMPCNVREIDDEEALELMLMENMHRQDVHPMEEAVGFAALQRISKLSVQDISDKIGKNWHYVADRLKLSKLIPELQKEYYQGRFNLVTATAVAATGEKYQKSWLAEQDPDDHDWSVTNVRSVSANLSAAPFSLEDATLVKSAGACIACPMNSHNSTLFPEGDPVCLNKLCYQQKCKAATEFVFKDAPAEAVFFSDDREVLTKEVRAKIGDRVIIDSSMEGYWRIQNSWIDYPNTEALDELGETFADNEDYSVDTPEEWKEAKEIAQREYDEAIKLYSSARMDPQNYLPVYVLSKDGYEINYIKPSDLAKIKPGPSTAQSKGVSKKDQLKALLSDEPESKPTLLNLSNAVDELKEDIKKTRELWSEKLFEKTRELVSKGSEGKKQDPAPFVWGADFNPEDELSWMQMQLYYMVDSIDTNDRLRFIRSVSHGPVYTVDEDGKRTDYSDEEANGEENYVEADECMDCLGDAIFSGMNGEINLVKFRKLQALWFRYKVDRSIQFKAGYRNYNNSLPAKLFIDWSRGVYGETVEKIEKELQSKYSKKIEKMSEDLLALEEKLAGVQPKKKSKKVKLEEEV